MPNLALRVEKTRAEQILTLLRGVGLLDTARRVVRSQGHVYVPVVQAPEQLPPGCEVVVHENPANPPRPSLASLLSESFGPQPVGRLPHSFDIIGSIVVINQSDRPPEQLRMVGEAIMGLHRNVRTVMVKSQPLSGEERVGGYTLVAGEGITETTHKESGCLYKLDITKVFFSPRLSAERLRVSRQVGAGEFVIDMFAGVGPFSILIAKKQPRSTVYSVEKSGEAYRYLVENIRLNRVDGNVTPLHGDVSTIFAHAEGLADRVIMNLPYEAHRFLYVASRLARQRAIIHFYSISPREEPSCAADLAARHLDGLGVTYEVLSTRVVKETAPSKLMVGLDIRVKL